MEALHKRLKRLRNEKQLTIKGVATQLGVSISTYREWEYGRKIQGEPYIKLAEILDVTLYELLTGEHARDRELLCILKEIESKILQAQKYVESLF